MQHQKQFAYSLMLKKILDELQQSTLGSKQTVFGAAFGPGLTMETFIVTYG